MAGGAVIVFLMIEQGVAPIFGAVAVAALAVVGVVGRGFGRVAALAVGVIGMVEGDAGPIVDAVAIAALAFVMIGRLIDCVALLAGVKPGVVKIGGVPIAGVVVAVDARAGVVVFGHGRFVAAFTLIDAHMVECA